ncbi:hypothetical protein H6G36_25665 [Anabaena minutissima FACHB-250]|nr:hypothetical protein [Anabaena minutissima FACHB-250]
MLYKLLIYLECKHEQKLIKTLSNIEFGVSTFCEKLSVAATKDNYPNLAKLLLKHSQEEHKHGKMLSSLADGKLRLPVKNNGRFLSLVRNEEETVELGNFSRQDGKQLEWDSATHPGQKVVAIFENLDGLSKRYISLRILFKNKSAFDYGWGDRLAFMQALESETCKFYQALSQSNCSEKLKAIASQITQDELGHSNYLSSLLYSFPDTDLEKWEERLFWAKLGLIFDVVRLLWTSN